MQIITKYVLQVNGETKAVKDLWDEAENEARKHIDQIQQPKIEIIEGASNDTAVPAGLTATTRIYNYNENKFI